MFAARAAIVTVEEIVDELSLQGPNQVVLPTWVIDAVALVPRGSHWALTVSEELTTTTPPSAAELRVLRSLKARTEAAHSR